MSPGRAWRLWQAARLQVPRKRPRKRIAAARPRPQAPTGPNQVWSYDFVFDRCANGQQLKCLTVWVGDRRGRPYPLAARDQSVVASGERARRAGLPAQRQRSGVRFQGSAVLDCRAGHRHRINRARQALAEWRRRKLQRQVSRRMPQPRMVPLARRSEDHYRVLAAALQRGAAAFEPWLPHAKRICSSANKKLITSPCNGPGRCGIWASAPRPVAPPAHIGHI